MMRYLVLLLSISYVYGGHMVNLRPKVVGGISASNGQFPYHAALKYLLTNQLLCSGSIISQEWILTAAQCYRVSSEAIVVVVGSVDLESDGFGYGVEQVIRHPNYSPGTSTSALNDIALIKTLGSMHFGDYVSPIALSSMIIIPENLPLMFTGWGYTDHQNKLSRFLQYNTLQSMSIRTCKQYLNPASDILIQCTDSNAKAGTCIGDAGGPLVYEYEQVGIEFYSGSCIPGTFLTTPSMFTKIAPYRTWIKEISGV